MMNGVLIKNETAPSCCKECQFLQRTCNGDVCPFLKRDVSDIVEHGLKLNACPALDLTCTLRPKELETLPDDTISRRGAIDAVHKIGVGKTSTIKAITAALESLPAEPCARKSGTWLDVEPAPFGQRYETCSECGVRQAVDKGKDKFCGVCGARMR